MGNNQSALTDKNLNKNQSSLEKSDFFKPNDNTVLLPLPAKIDKDEGPSPHVPTLDFTNMPFLRPTEGQVYSTEEVIPDESPLLSSDKALSPGSVNTQWHTGHSRQPFYHRVNSSSSQMFSVEADINSASVDSLFISTVNRSPVMSEDSFHMSNVSSAESSVSLQLSMLSQKAGGSSPRSHRYAFSYCPQQSEIEVDVNMPPPVPPHFILPSSLKANGPGPQLSENNSFLESALAEVDALEEETEEDLNLSRTRPRSASSASRSRSRSLSHSMSRSFSRSHSKSHSLASLSSHNPDDSSFSGNLSTDIFTRKCSPQDYPGLTRDDDDYPDENDSYGPPSPDKSSFALAGYHDGHTILRVVNQEDNEIYGEQLDDRHSHSFESMISQRIREPEKFLVKSKAQLADEEDRQRRRYARYGQPFRICTMPATLN